MNKLNRTAPAKAPPPKKTGHQILQNSEPVYDVIIVGAGAAGLFAAASCPPGTKGVILEKTKQAGTKLLMSGAGQCNFTHGGNPKDFLLHYGENGTKLRPVLYPFSNLALIEYFESKGIKTIIREDGKVFPKSLRARDIQDLLLQEARQKGFEILYNCPVTNIVPILKTPPNDALFSIHCGKQSFMAKKLIITTGGNSYPSTGSDGSMFGILKNLGIEIRKPKPALVPIFVQNYPYGDLAGLSFDNARITIGHQGHKAIHTGSLLFTHTSFSGPGILDISRFACTGHMLSICYVPHMNQAEMLQEAKKHLSGNKKHAETFLSSVFDIPRRFAAILCQRLSLTGNVSSLSKTQLQSAISLLANDTFSISGTGGFQEAMCTSGGVCLSEVDLKTMALKKYSHLHVAGEVLDVDGDTGGYNLQFAFSSAFAAAQDS